MKCYTNPYEGNQEYIFFSYCHDDASLVYPVIERLSIEGFRVWYDNGIHPGDDWPEVIAAHLSKAKVCVAAISKASAESHNCRNEVSFAIANNKPFISIIIEDFPMPLGMQLQLSSSNYIKYDDHDAESFYQKLIAAPTLVNCRNQGDTASPSALTEWERHIQEYQERPHINPTMVSRGFIIDPTWFEERERLEAEIAALNREREEAEARLKKEKERLQAEAEKRQAEEERLRQQRLALEEANRRAEQDRLVREAEAKRQAEEEAHRRAEQERLAREAEAKRQAEEEAQRRAEQERLAREAEAKRQAEESRQKAEQERLAREAEAKRQAEEEAQQKAEQERLARETEAKRQAEEEAHRRAEQERLAREAEAKRQAKEEAQRKAEQERLAREAEAKRQAEEARQKAEQERLAREAEAKRQAEEEARRRAEQVAGKVNLIKADASGTDGSNVVNVNNGAILIRMKTGEIFKIRNNVVRIGRAKDSDIVFSGNRAISHMHMEVAETNDGYSVRNTSSSSVDVNGLAIQPGETAALNECADLTLAGEQCFFVYGSAYKRIFEEKALRMLRCKETGETKLFVQDILPLNRYNKWKNNVLGDQRISREHHAELFRDGLRSMVRDVGSLHGTFLNGRRLNVGESAELHNGDIIAVVETEFIYYEATIG